MENIKLDGLFANHQITVEKPNNLNERIQAHHLFYVLPQEPGSLTGHKITLGKIPSSKQ